jgi:Skp family chaperone for outer membrane proteins
MASLASDTPSGSLSAGSSSGSPSASSAPASPAAAPTSVRGKLDRAEELRAAGGIKFQKKKYKSAVRKYARIAAWVSPFAKPAGGDPSAAYAEMMGQGERSAGSSDAPATESEQGEAQTLMRIAHQNTAMCFVKLKDGARAVASCRKALNYDDGTMGKVYRTLAHSHLLQRDIDEARAALDKVAALMAQDAELLAKGDKMTSKLEALYQTCLQQHEKRERKRYAGMFDK